MQDLAEDESRANPVSPPARNAETTSTTQSRAGSSSSVPQPWWRAHRHPGERDDRSCGVLAHLGGLVGVVAERREDRPRALQHEQRRRNHAFSSLRPSARAATSGSDDALFGRTCLRNCPVNDSSVSATCSGVPVAMISPPASPPSGPRSTIQSACLITSRLCSITSTVLPRVDQPLEHLEQLLDVLEVQARRRLVEDVERPARSRSSTARSRA